MAKPRILDLVFDEAIELAFDDFDPSEPRDETGEWTSGGGAPSKSTGKAKKAPKAPAPPPEHGSSFVSPSVSDIGFKQAHADLHSRRQLALQAASSDVDRSLGLSTRDRSAIGAWSDGAENSIMTEFKGASLDQLRVASAMKAHLADQKAVLVFHDNPQGKSWLYKFKATGPISQIHQQLLEDGIPFHTLIPTGGGATIYVADIGSHEMAEKVKKAAERYGSETEAVQGDGEFIGYDEDRDGPGDDRQQRDFAKSAYERIIGGSGIQGAPDVWSRVHDSYGDQLQRPLKLTPAELSLTKTPIMDHGELGEERPPGSKRVFESAAELNARGQEALKRLGIKSGKIEGPDPKTDELLSKAIAAEVTSDIEREKKGGSRSWYSGKIREAMSIAALIHPEIATSKNAAMALKAAIAITSQGETVPSNLRLGEAAYAYYKKNGRFPTNVESKAKVAMNANFKKMNTLLDALGPDGTRDFLEKEFSVKDLEGRAASMLQNPKYKLSGTNRFNNGEEATVYGSAILGPKIGQGFYQNLNGNFDTLTTDLWFMRGWGRLTGTLVGNVDPKTVAAQKDRLMKELGGAGGRKIGDNQLEAIAQRIVDDHERALDAHQRADKEAKTKTPYEKSELIKAAERYILGKHGVKDHPSSGGERQWISNVVRRAVNLLGASGHDNMSMADLQAAWWYPEKNLYTKMGGRDNEAINEDYSSAFADLARDRGVSVGAITKAIGSE